jgi:hypothetical protein
VLDLERFQDLSMGDPELEREFLGDLPGFAPQAVKLNVHFHTLHLDGVFRRNGDAWHFVPAPPPTARELARLVAAIARRIERLLARRSHPLAESDENARDPLAEDAPALAALCRRGRGCSRHMRGRCAVPEEQKGPVPHSERYVNQKGLQCELSTAGW